MVFGRRQVKSLEQQIPRTQRVCAISQGLVLLCTMLASVSAVLGLQVLTGLGRIITLYYCPSILYRIC